MLQETEKTYLHNLVKIAIDSGLTGKQFPIPAPPSETLSKHLGAFVTLRLQGNLRGCIGRIESDRPLFETIFSMARAAAFHDPRFAPLSQEEFQEIETEISILTPVQPVTDTKTILPGRHGLIVQKGRFSGLLLPQVATEYGWDTTTFLEQTCQKAGLPKDAWQEKDTRIFSFQAEVF